MVDMQNIGKCGADEYKSYVQALGPRIPRSEVFVSLPARLSRDKDQNRPCSVLREIWAIY